MCSPAIQPSGQPSTTPSLPQCEGARPALFRKVSRNQPARPGRPAATLVKDYPPPSCTLTYAYPASAWCRLRDWGLCPLDASQLTGSSGNAARRRGHSNSRGQARFTSARAHFWRRLPDANWAPSEARAQTNANMTASVVGYHAPGMGDGVDGRTRQGRAGANRKWEKVGAR